VFEIAPISEEAVNAISSGAGRAEILRTLRQAGATPILADALKKVQAGITSLEEALRFAQGGDGDADRFNDDAAHGEVREDDPEVR